MNNYAELIIENEINFGSDMCRACLSNKNLQSLYIDENKTESESIILQKFNYCTAFKVSWNDYYPKHICDSCLNKLDVVYDFLIKCKNSVNEIDKIKEKLHHIDNKNEIKPIINNIDIILEDNIASIDDSLNQKSIFKYINKETKSKNMHKLLENEKQHLENYVKTVKQTYLCYNCKSIFSIFDEYVKHTCGMVQENGEFRKCNQKFKTNDLRCKHTRLHHTSSQKFICTNFTDDIISKNKLDNHKAKCIKEDHNFFDQYNQGNKTYHESKCIKRHICKQCNKDFRRPYELKEHMIVHFGLSIDKSFLCQHCGQIFKNNKRLRVHEAIHSNLKPFECTKCKKMFKSKIFLQNHMRAHIEEKKYMCKHCDKKFTTWHSKNNHIKVHHTTEKPFVCNICSKAFKFSESLKLHLRQHSGEKPYSCSECNMSFARKGSMKNHMLTHTGERNHSCPVCNKAFARAQHVKQHMVTHTGERKHKCNVCEKAFTQAHVLRTHMKTHDEISIKKIRNFEQSGKGFIK